MMGGVDIVGPAHFVHSTKATIMNNPQSIALAAAIAITGTASAAVAQQAPVRPLASSPASSVADAAFATSAIAETDLGGVTGREDTGAMIASATQRNTVSNNSVIGTSTTGNVRIDGNAFQNLQGLAVISANSGNNVAMNSAMNVTVNLAPR